MPKKDKDRTVAGTVDDPTIQFVDLQIDGKVWKLAWSFNAIAKAEAETGLNLMLGVSGLVLSAFTATHFRALLWAALLTAHPNVTLDDAGRLITRAGFGQMHVVREKLLESYGVSLPEKDKQDPPAAGAAADEGSRTANSGSAAGLSPESTSG